MLHLISWQQFFDSILVLISIYYLLVGCLYFRKEIYQLLKNGISVKKTAKELVSLPKKGNTITRQSDEQPLPEDTLFNIVYKLIEELKPFFANAKSKRYNKEELVWALQIKLKEYNQLRETPFEVALNNHVTEQARQSCDVDLGEYDLKQIWQ